MRYTSERVLEEALTMKDVLLPGLNLALNSEFTPVSGKVNLGLTSTFRYIQTVASGGVCIDGIIHVFLASI